MMSPETSTNCLIQNIPRTFFKKNKIPTKLRLIMKNNQKSLYLGKQVETKSKNPSRKTYQPIFRLTY